MQASMMADRPAANPGVLGERILVIGASCSGKSTLAQALATRLEIPFVELDALFWEPGWTEPTDAMFRERINAAIAGNRWVIAGNYLRHTKGITWPRAETVIWLDLPLSQTIWRTMHRTYRRWRTRELLWGTNVERFWPQFKIWSQKDSLLAYNLATHRRRKAETLAAMRDPEWAHLRFVHLTSSRDVARLLSNL